MTAGAQAESPLWHGTERDVRDTERRRRLLDAALELYGTVGYGSTTVGAVCRLAKVSTRSFYELYSEHQELLAHLYLDLNQEVLGAITGGTGAPAGDVLAATRMLVAAALGPMLADERKARVMQVEVVGVSAEMERQRRHTNRQLAGAVDEAFEGFAAAGLIDKAPGGLAGIILIGGITEALVQRVQTDPGLRGPTPEFIDSIAKVIVTMTGRQPGLPGS